MTVIAGAFTIFVTALYALLAKMAPEQATSVFVPVYVAAVVIPIIWWRITRHRRLVRHRA